MRGTAAMFGLLASAGCNWVFGIDSTAPAPQDAPAVPPGSVALQYQIAPGGKLAPVEHAPITDVAVTVEVGALASDKLVAAIYDAASGSFPVPDDLYAAPWRAVLRVGTRVETEVQWQPAKDAGFLTVPVFGARPPQPIPTASGYAVKPTGYTLAAQNRELHRIYTTGVWTQTVASVNALQFVAPFAAEAVHLSEPRIAPSATDQVLAVDLVTTPTPSCQRVVGAAVFSVALAEGVNAEPSPQPVWDENPVRNKTPMVSGAAGIFGRLMQIPPGTINLSRITAGYTAIDKMPMFTLAPVANPPPSLELPRLPSPAMIPLESCDFASFSLGDGPMPPYYDPLVLADSFQQVLHVEVMRGRVVAGGGPTLFSGISVVASHNNQQMPTFQPVHTAASPTAIKLNGTALADDGDTITASGTAVELELTPTSGEADYWEILLHEVTGTTTQVKRRFLVLGPKLSVLKSLFTAGSTYVFELRAFDGFNGAQTGDFRPATLPQSATTVFTRTFKVQ